MITFIIDEITPCLKDLTSNLYVETEVFPIKKKTYLSNYNKKNGWYTNWAKLAVDNEIYALAVKGTSDIQGLIALRNDISANAVYIQWACTAPQNNKSVSEHPKYAGVGGHLFAIAMHKSVEYGHNGAIHAIAANSKVLDHYVNCFHAAPIGFLHPYHFAIGEEQATVIMEEYDYDWTEQTKS